MYLGHAAQHSIHVFSIWHKLAVCLFDHKEIASCLVRGSVECVILLTHSREHGVEASEMFRSSLTVLFPGQVFLRRVEGNGHTAAGGSVVVPCIDRRNAHRLSIMCLLGSLY